MQNRLEVFKFPSVERNTYDRYECTAKNQIYPYIGDKVGNPLVAMKEARINKQDRFMLMIYKVNRDINFSLKIIRSF